MPNKGFTKDRQQLWISGNLEGASSKFTSQKLNTELRSTMTLVKHSVERHRKPSSIIILLSYYPPHVFPFLYSLYDSISLFVWLLFLSCNLLLNWLQFGEGACSRNIFFATNTCPNAEVSFPLQPLHIWLIPIWYKSR